MARAERHEVQAVDQWEACIRRGDFEAAWRVCDAVLAQHRGQPCWHLPRHLQYVWDGRPLHDQRVLIRCYHGLGDTIQFIRYATLLREIASKVVVWAQPSLLQLLETADGIDELLPLHDGSVDVDYDADVEIMELPHVFRSTLQSLPRSVPYLHVESATLPRARTVHVGLVWRAGDWDEARSLRFNQVLPLFDVPGVKVHVLQRGPALDEWQTGYGTLSGSDDVFELARIMRALDLVITVDSMPAHLAGALGVPVWILLRRRADWRWLEDRIDSPWYPTARLFRQQQPADWTSLVAKVRVALAQFARSTRRT